MADISKIKIPDGTSLNIKDATARQAIENLPKPMVFKGSLGTGGTITSLPTASSSNTGYVYKVIKAGTYASQSAKIGDTFVSDGSSWVLIPSGDEPSGTVTSIKISATSPININNSAAITTSGTRTISHASSGVSSGTYKSVTVNSTGHVTAGTNPTTIDGYGITDSAGRIVTGKEYTIGSNTVVAGTGAEVFNEYSGATENIAVGDYSHAEGSGTTAIGMGSHAEGGLNVAEGTGTHAEGAYNTAKGDYSHVEGYRCQTNGDFSHAEGIGTVAYGNYQHVEGKYNVRGTGSSLAFIIGNGTDLLDTSNAFAIDWDGKIYTNNASTGIDVNKLAEKVVEEGIKNLLENTGTTQTIKGVTFTVNDDGTVSVNGTNNSSSTAVFYLNVLPADTAPNYNGCRLTGCPQGGSTSTYRLAIQLNSGSYTTYASDTGDGTTIRNIPLSECRVVITVYPGVTVNNLIFKPMICTAEDYVINSEYVPYAKLNYQLTKDVGSIPKLVDDGAKNLLKITGTSQTINGVTFTVNDDGTVTVNGTNTGTGSATFIFVPNQQAILIPDGDYMLSGCPQGGGNNTFDLRWFRYSSGASAYDTGSGAVVRKNGNTADSNIAIVVKAGKTVNNVVFKPMLCTVEDYAISSEYVPYAKSNYQLTRDVRPIPKLVDDGAKNLLKNTAPYGDIVKTNITFTHNDDDTYVVNATSANTVNTDLYVASNIPIKTGIYVLSGCPEGGNNSNTYKLQIAGIGYDLGDGHTFKISQDTTISVYIRIWNGYVPNNLVFKPMICTVDEYITNSEYVPYAPSNRGLYEEVEYIENAMRVSQFNTATFSSLTAYADTLSNGTYSFLVPNNNTLPDVPMNNANAIVKITVYSAGTATMEFWPISSAVNGQLFTQTKSSGTWRGWYKFEGTAVADDTWITLKSGPGTGISASDVKYRLNGKTMCITGYVKPSSTAASVTIGTLAEKYRPISLQTDHVSQASGIAETTFSAQVLTDGTVKFQGNSASAITANIQYYFTLTYIVAK